MKFNISNIKQLFNKIFGAGKKAEEDNITAEEDNTTETTGHAEEEASGEEPSVDDLYAGFEDILEQVKVQEDEIDTTVRVLSGGYEEVAYDSIPDDLRAPVESMQQYADIVEEGEEAGSDETSDIDKFLDQYAVQHISTDNVAVYETENREEDGASAELDSASEKEKKKEASMFMFMIGITGFLILMIIIIYTVFVLIIMQANSKKPAAAEIKTISTPQYATNNMNFALVNDVKMLNEKNIMLKKILLDSTASIFYFKGNLDTRAYRFILYDSNRKMYNMDFSFMVNQESEENSSETETLIRFEPFNKAITGLTLEMTDLLTSEKVSFVYTLGSNFNFSEIKYLDKPIKVDTGIDGFEIIIEDAVFSSASSTINYVVKTTADASGGYYGIGSSSESISLTEANKSLTSLRKKPLEYNIMDFATLGRMDFAAVKNLNSTVFFHFSDLIMNMEHNETINPHPLLNQTPINIDTEDYLIVLEGMRVQGDRLVLVCHAEDKNTNDRVEVVLDTEMSILTDSGVEIVLEGDVLSGKIGADIRYDLTKYKNILGKMTGISYSLKINNIQIKMNDLIIPLDLSSMPAEKKYGTSHAADAVINAFNNRLAYKSGRLSLVSLKGFSKDLLENEALMRHYEPQQARNTAMYSSQIVAHYFEGETMYAVVQESWNAVLDGRETSFFRTHMIRAEKMNSDYIITEDKII